MVFLVSRVIFFMVVNFFWVRVFYIDLGYGFGNGLVYEIVLKIRLFLLFRKMFFGIVIFWVLMCRCCYRYLLILGMMLVIIM